MTIVSPPSAFTPVEWASDGGTAPVEVPVLANFVLTGPGSSSEKRHVELDLSGTGLACAPGDALAVLPRNDPAVVENLLTRLGLPEGACVRVDGGPMTLGEALATRFEIATASPRFLRHWAMLSGSAELKDLTARENPEGRRRYLHENHVGDIVRDHPVPGIDAETVLAGLRPLRPRLFSLASSLLASPNVAAITTSTLAYRLHGGELRRGVASGYFIPQAGPGSRLRIHVEAAPDFHLPADEVPIIMVGAGTGVAPFRAFLSERRARAARGRSWLFFGGRNRQSDFIYRSDWQLALDAGYLARVDTAFSRDASPKTYVQHRLLQSGAMVYAWLEDGASLYVCGDAAGMAPAVHAALLEIVATHGGMKDDRALDYVRRLARAHRYQRSIY
jgi:sulfite reductase (NADPH) flavoprotein alpha-component